MQAHFALFATYMRPDVRPPTMSRTIAVGSMMSQKLDEPYDRSKSKVAADSCALQTTDRETTSAPELYAVRCFDSNSTCDRRCWQHYREL